MPCACNTRYHSVPYLDAGCCGAHFDRPSAEQHAETLSRKQRDERTDHVPSSNEKKEERAYIDCFSFSLPQTGLKDLANLSAFCTIAVSATHDGGVELSWHTHAHTTHTPHTRTSHSSPPSALAP